MNTKQLTKRFNDLLNIKQRQLPENKYDPLGTPKRARTVYPHGEKQMSLNGKHEWYGLQEK
jgi:hypothetical protein